MINQASTGLVECASSSCYILNQLEAMAEMLLDTSSLEMKTIGARMVKWIVGRA